MGGDEAPIVGDVPEDQAAALAINSNLANGSGQAVSSVLSIGGSRRDSFPDPRAGSPSRPWRPAFLIALRGSFSLSVYSFFTGLLATRAASQ
jgi:hypothetical protein